MVVVAMVEDGSVVWTVEERERGKRKDSRALLG